MYVIKSSLWAILQKITKSFPKALIIIGKKCSHLDWSSARILKKILELCIFKEIMVEMCVFYKDGEDYW